MQTAPRRYTPQEKEALTTRALSLIQQGHTRADAAKTLNMGKSTLYDWLAARQDEAVQAQRAAMLEYLDSNGGSAEDRLYLLLHTRAQLWNAWAARVPHIDADAMRMLAAIDRLDKMLDRLTGGLYFMPKPAKPVEPKAVAAPDSTTASTDVLGFFPAEIPAVGSDEVDDIVDNEELEADNLKLEFSGDIPAEIPARPLVQTATRRQPPRKKGAPIPPSWGFKRSKR